ncbi:MAG: LemA family protein [Proteobacteria bacterium]|nr:LemA family protein [Pseudomonadota bacterium]MCL2307751.1 LemA family protein [Pseudomonadota bacterium]
MASFLYFLLALIVLIGVFLAVIYNRLIASRNAFKNAFSQIDVQLTRRYDLIPNLVESVKAYLKHENETLLEVTRARNLAAGELKTAAGAPGDATLMQHLTQANNALNSSLGRLMLVVEAYPDLKANQNIMQFSEELASTENRIAFARQAYNDEVMRYNTLSQIFPNNLVAGVFGFQPAALLEAESGKRDVPKVQF